MTGYVPTIREIATHENSDHEWHTATDFIGSSPLLVNLRCSCNAILQISDVTAKHFHLDMFSLTKFLQTRVPRRGAS